MKLVWYLLHNSTGAFYAREKAQSNVSRLQKLDLKQQYPGGIAPLRQEKISYHSNILKGTSHTMLSLNMPRRRIPFGWSNTTKNRSSLRYKNREHIKLLGGGSCALCVQTKNCRIYLPIFLEGLRAFSKIPLRRVAEVKELETIRNVRKKQTLHVNLVNLPCSTWKSSLARTSSERRSSSGIRRDGVVDQVRHKVST